MDQMRDAAADSRPTGGCTLEDVPVGDARERVLSRLVSDVYRESPPLLRARLLECLLRPVGPLALAAVAAGAFGRFLHRDHWSALTVSLDDTLRFSSEQIFELARFVDQARPEALAPLGSLMAENPLSMATLSGSLLLMALRLWVPGAPDSQD